jgi:hypothetical protein
MARPSPSSNTARASADPDGIVRTRTARGGPSWYLWLGAAALLALAGAGLWLWRGGRSPTPAGSSRSVVTAPASGRPGAPGRKGSSPAPGQPAKPTSEPSADIDDEDDTGSPPAGEEPGRGGIYAFPAPGTKRIKVGVIVPEGFELPPGYVRHYQATDRGEMLPAILMYNPREPPVDARGRPVDIPEDHIVPADRAPPGLPIEMLRVPDNAYADPHDPGPIPESAGADDTDP